METLAHGIVEVEVEDRAAIARLEKIREEYHRTMSAIDHDEATAQIDADIAPLEDKVIQARRRLKALEGERATAKIAGDKKQLDRQIKGARTSLKRLEGEKATVEIEAKGAEKTIATIEAVRRAAEKRMVAENKLQREQDVLAENLWKKKQARIAKESRMRESLNKQRTRELTTAEREAYQMERERNEVPKLEAQYMRLQQRMENLGKARKKARGDDRAVAIVGKDIESTMADMERVRNEVRRRVGRDPIHVDVLPSLSQRAGESLRRNLVGRTVGGAIIGTAHELGQTIGNRMTRGFKDASERGFRNAGRDISRSFGRSVAGGVGSVLSKVGHGLEGLSSLTVRLGPFTTSLKGLMIGLSLLGPVIVDIVGALGSLVSVAGAAALGVGALGAAVAGGGIPVLLGMGLVIKSVVKDFQNAQKSQQKYNDAVLHYGKNSKQAQTALAQLRSTMGGVSKETAQQFATWNKTKGQWRELTAPARRSVFTSIGDGMKTATALMPQFAKRTNEAMDIAQKGTSKWMSSLRSKAGRSALDEMMKNFNASLGPVLNGLGSLAGYLGRVGQIASRSLPGLAHTFENWAKSVNSVDTATLTGKVNRVIQVAKDLGRWFMAAGRLMKAFFAGGVDAGDGFVNTMTDAMNRWTAFLESPKGHNELQAFFKQSVQGVQALWSFLAPVAKSFVMWAEALAPLSRAFFSFLGMISQFVTALLSITALRGPLTAIATTLGVLWGIGKIGAAVSAVRAFTMALLGLAAAEKSVAAGGAAMKMGSLMAGATRVGGAVKAVRAEQAATSAMPMFGPRIAGDTAKAGVAAERAAGGFARFKSAAGGAVMALTGLQPEVAAAVVGVGALGFGLYKLATRQSDATKAAKRLKDDTASYQAAVRATPQTLNDSAQAHLAYSQAVTSVKQAEQDSASTLARVNKLRREGKQNTQEYKNAVVDNTSAENNYKQSLIDQYNQQQQLLSAVHKQRAAGEAIQVQARKRIADQSDVVSGIRKEITSMGEIPKKYQASAASMKAYVESHKDQISMSGPLLDKINKLAGAEDRLKQVQQQAQAGMHLWVLSQVNAERAMAGMVPMADSAAHAVANLTAALGKAATTKVALKFPDPKQAQGVMQALNYAISAGVSKPKALKVALDSRNAEQAIRRLNALKLQAKTLRIIEKGGSETLARLRAIVGAKLAPKVQHILASDASARSKIKQMIALGIPPKIARILGNNTDAKRKAAEANAQRMRDLIQSIMRKIVNPPGLFGTIQSAVQNIVRRVKDVKVKAAGRRPGMKEDAWVGEGANWRGAKEYIANTKTGTITQVDKPTIMALDRHDAVIPTESAYRNRGRNIFKSIASDLGIPGFRKGKKPKNPAATAHQVSTATRGARSLVSKKAHPVNYSTDNLRELADVETAKRSENNLRDQVQREAGLLDKQEPSTFLVETGKTATGDPIYELDQGAVDRWSAALNHMADRFQDLLTAILNTLSKVNIAMGRIGDPYNGPKGSSNPRGTVIGDAWHNKNTLRAEITKQNRIIGNKKSSKAAVGMAKARLGVYTEAMQGEDASISAATSDWKLMDDEKNDIGDDSRGRIAEAKDTIAQYHEDARSIQGKSEQELTDKNPKDTASEIADPFAAQNNALAGLSAEQSLAQIGQGIAGQSPRTAEAISGDIAKFNQQIIDQANAMLRDSDPTNDQAAYTAIQSAAQAISGLAGGAGSPGFSAGQSMAYSNARSDLYKSFGSNFALASSFGRTGGAFGSAGGGYPYGVNPAMAPMGSGGIVFNQNFQQMPDPHTWSQSVAFELQAAM